MKQAHLIIFAKYPRQGEVKTRLGKEIGNEKAAILYQQCAEYTFKIAQQCHNAEVAVYCGRNNDLSAFSEWLNLLGHNDFRTSSQVPDADLGRRIFAAMQTGLTRSPKVIIIGTDAPNISSDLIDRAITALDSYDTVFGPAMDGGFYLMGLRKIHENLFDDVVWSTNSVLSEMSRNCQNFGFSIAPRDTLPCIRDIDYKQDLETWISEEANECHPLLQSFMDLLKDE
eukprot:TRINITY_DN7567_c0_g1_i1.p1 TRINITY_DN7567_c0_g1~~TRINITY_DN7567_c0_g1_i1.p1  ORF type:complete len:227 (+),score=22.58 TRINITY_DN7567_c0_g1_i1:807-1487(+)